MLTVRPTPKTVAVKPRSNVYPIHGGGVLFVPTDDMWRVHEASKDSAVCARAGIARLRWDKDDSELTDYLRSRRADPPVSRPSSPAMKAFRREATIAAILRGAKRPTEGDSWRKDYRPEIGDNLVSYWLKKFADEAWFRGWLLAGEDPPRNMTVATMKQVERCSAAWDFAAFCNRVGIRADSTYVLWIKRGTIPNLDWLKWLYGGHPPAGAFVVTREVQRLRRQRGRKAILASMGLTLADAWRWQNSASTSDIFAPILAGRPISEGEWSGVHPTTRKQMEAFSSANSWEASCERAGVSMSTYRAAVAEANRCGVGDELSQYLNLEGRYSPDRSRQSGLLAKNFFVPTEDMLGFRDEAVREGARQQVWALFNDLPGIDEWFRDWTAPKPHRGRRHVVVSMVHSETQANGHSIPRSSGDPTPPPPVDYLRPPARRGRQKNPATREKYRICSELYERVERKEWKMATAMKEARNRLGADAPKKPSHLRENAKRYRRMIEKEEKGAQN